MPTLSEGLTVADIDDLKVLDVGSGSFSSLIRKVTSIDSNYPQLVDRWYRFYPGASYTEQLPGIVASTAQSGQWVMFPSPLVISSAAPTGLAQFVDMQWINVSNGDRFYSSPNLVWILESGGGSSATTTITSGFTQPAVNSTVTINVGDSASFPLGSWVYIDGGGVYQVTSVVGPTQLEINNEGVTGNAAPSTTIASGALVSFSGSPGTPVNTNVTSLGTVTTGTHDFDWEAAGSTVTVDGAVTFQNLSIGAGKRSHEVLLAWTSGTITFFPVTWVDGVAPSVTGKTYKLSFFTYDGGTTVYGDFAQLGA